MRSFKDFNIKPKVNSFVGEKIKVEKLFNLLINVLDYKIEPSNKNIGTECLTLQIEKAGEKRIVFTGSKVLIGQIKQVPQESFPFTATIKGENDYYEFT